MRAFSRLIFGAWVTALASWSRGVTRPPAMRGKQSAIRLFERRRLFDLQAVRERTPLHLGLGQLSAATGRAIRLRVDSADLMACTEQGIECRHREGRRSGEHDAEP